ncbi:hypothetical protein GCM10025874_02330 [Arenivirga flava]|uniref:Uncharacterized protein n=1 Tax=Arenivirga flava TaxID=1930060 RepID=A0AA37UAT6_9MICO|nr:hypothetical protein GCM10025874_02330 [Arenivirga flava]
MQIVIRRLPLAHERSTARLSAPSPVSGSRVIVQFTGDLHEAGSAFKAGSIAHGPHEDLSPAAAVFPSALAPPCRAAIIAAPEPPGGTQSDRPDTQPRQPRLAGGTTVRNTA